MLRLDAADEKNPPESAVDFPNSGDSSTPTGWARLTLFRMFRPIAEKLNEYRRAEA